MRRPSEEHERVIVAVVLTAVPMAAIVGAAWWSGAYGAWTCLLGLVVGVGLGLATSGWFWCYLLEDFVVLPQDSCRMKGTVLDVNPTPH